MYLKFFALRQTPFGDADISSLFWTPKRQELATLLQNVIVERKGMTVLTGEDGSGKTSFVRAVLANLASEQLKIISVSGEKLSFPLALQVLVRELGGSEAAQGDDTLPSFQIPERPAHPLSPLEDVAPFIRALRSLLLAHYDQQRGPVVLVIDDAHHLPVKTLKDFHWLSMLETPEGKLLQIIFIGNAKLSIKLEMPQLQPLKQRVALQGDLAPLSFEESFVYLLSRIRTKPGVRLAAPIFSVEALRLMARNGKGNLYTMNTLANAALRTAATRKQRPISGPLMLEIIGEFRTLLKMQPSGARIQLTRPPLTRRRSTTPPQTRRLWAASMGAAAAALVLFSYNQFFNKWPVLLPDLTRLLRNNTVAQAAPGTEPAPSLPAIPPAGVLPSPLQTTTETVQPTKPQNEDKKKRKAGKETRKSQDDDRTSSRPPSKHKEDKIGNFPSGTASVPHVEQEVNASEIVFPGKILYRIPLDPSANRDRLFDN